MKIFTPKDAETHSKKYLPDYVIRAFNELLSEKYNANAIKIYQDEAIARILRTCSNEDMTRQQIFQNKWLDIEDWYGRNGWIVTYDKPGFNEDYDAYFIFKPIK